MNKMQTVTLFEFKQYSYRVGKTDLFNDRDETFQFSEKTLSDPERLKRYLASCPLGRVGQPIDIVGTCIFLASPASDFITGQIIYLDGGLTAVA